MGGVFGVVSKKECIDDLFYGTDYQSHLGTLRGGLAAKNKEGYTRYIHDITNSQFRSKFENDIKKMHGDKGIGVVSDTDDQPLIFKGRHGKFGLVTVGKINNIYQLVAGSIENGNLFRDEGENPTELVAAVINQGDSFVHGIKKAQESIDGSCSMLLLTEEGIYAARDKLGRTPLIIGKKEGSYAVSSETTAFPNLDYEIEKYLGPGEITLMTAKGIKQKKEPNENMQICSFLWVYYGYPTSDYEDINTEVVRYECGKALARRDKEEGLEIDMVAGIPDSGTGHGLGYAHEMGIPFMRPFSKYTPTWPRSFMPQDQAQRDLVARMKLIPNKKLIKGKRLMFCEDSIVRGTQLQDTIQRLYDYGAIEVHMRPACPPLTFGCDFLNFSRSRSLMDLATRKGIKELGFDDVSDELLQQFSNPGSMKQLEMIEEIRKRLKLTTLKYQRLPDLIEAIGMPEEKLCKHCWDGKSYF